MDIERFIKTVPSEFYAWGSLCAHPKDSKRYVEGLAAIQHMTTPTTMHLLNHAVRCMDGGECYLEVGTWRGATIIGALLGNEGDAVAIDNGSMTEFDGDGRASMDVCLENVIRHAVDDRVTYIPGSTPAIWPELVCPRPVGVYFFDGDKATTEAAYEGLMGVAPFLAPQALIICDDANTPQIREAAFWFCHQYRDKATKILDLPTPGNTWPSFWNGLLVIAWGVSIEREG